MPLMLDERHLLPPGVHEATPRMCEAFGWPVGAIKGLVRVAI